MSNPPATLNNPVVSAFMPIVSAATTTTSVSVAQVSVQIIPANPARIGFMLYNNSANSCYVTYGTTSTGSTCSFILPTFTQYIHTIPVCYTGPLAAIRNAGSGTITITEFLLTVPQPSYCSS